ncbi:hypothetical protein ACWGI8_06105 [Streptomyces sp. NPDC054841]
MLTYYEVMNTNFGQLTTTAGKWDAMAGEIKKMEDLYRDSVQKITTGPNWSGVSADAAHTNFAGTRYEYSAAQIQAKAIASLLRDARDQFIDLKKRLESARAEAVKAGMSVSEQGHVSFDTQRLTKGEYQAYVHDREYQDSCHKAVASWQKRIDDCVRAVDDADQGVKLALEAAVTDGYGDKNDATLGVGFNGRAQGDIEVYEAQNAEDIATRITSGKDVSAAEMAELKRAFRDNSGTAAFSQTLLNGLGAKGTIEFTNKLNDLIHVKDVKNKGDYAALEKGLASSLASATQNPKSDFYQKFRSDLQKAGMERYSTSFTDLRLEKARGYQSLVTLMQQGDGYSKQFLHDIGDDIIKAEKDGTDVWVMKGDYSGKEDGWFANDPMDGLLGVMSHDPAAAASFLKDDDRMAHLMKRDWEVVLEAKEVGNATHYSPALDGDERAGFGAALVAGATGMDPSQEYAKPPKHSADNVAVLKNSIEYMAGAEDEFPESLRDPMAKILVNHGDTVHQSASSVDMGASPLEQNDLFEVIKQVSKDQDSYAALNVGINHAMVTDIHADGQKDPQESLIRAGRTVGFLEQARTEAVGDPEVAAWDEKWMFDQAIGYLPVGGDLVQGGFDYVTEKWLEDEQKRIDDEHADKTYKAAEKRNHQLMALAEQWDKVHDAESKGSFQLKEVIEEASGRGQDRAKEVAGEPT